MRPESSILRHKTEHCDPLRYHKFSISVFIQHGLSGFSSVASRRKGSDGAEVGILLEKVPTPILPIDPKMPIQKINS